MAWGMINPSNIGDYFPDGDYVGWEEKLKAHWENGISPELKARFVEESVRERSVAHSATYSAFVSYKFVREQGTQIFGKPPFTPIEAHEWPEEYRTVFPCKTLGSLIKLHSFMIAVDPALKAIIERIEPGVHTFSPIRIGQLGPDSQMFTYYVLVIRNFRDSFSPEQSDKSSWKERLGGYYSLTEKTKKAMAGFALSKTAIAGAHLWRERKVHDPMIYFSDALEASFEDAGLRIPRRFRLKEV